MHIYITLLGIITSYVGIQPEKKQEKLLLTS